MLAVIYDASSEVRGAIMMSTVMVVLVFAPLFALSGMAGRMFTPLGIAYVVSITASTLVSLTVTPVLSYYLLPKGSGTKRPEGCCSASHQDSRTSVVTPEFDPWRHLCGFGGMRRVGPGSRAYGFPHGHQLSTRL